jgi:hypothetical protein
MPAQITLMIVATLSPASHGDNFLEEETSEEFTTGNLRTYVECGTRARNGRSYGGQSLFTIGLLKHRRGFLSPRAHFDGRRVSSELILITSALRQQS